MIWVKRGDAYRTLGRSKSSTSGRYNKEFSSFDDGVCDDKAIECYDKAITIQPNLIDALQWKTECFVNLKKFEEALKYNDKVLEIGSNDSAA